MKDSYRRNWVGPNPGNPSPYTGLRLPDLSVDWGAMKKCCNMKEKAQDPKHAGGKKRPLLYLLSPQELSKPREPEHCLYAKLGPKGIIYFSTQFSVVQKSKLNYQMAESFISNSTNSPLPSLIKRLAFQIRADKTIQNLLCMAGSVSSSMLSPQSSLL